MKKNKTTRRNKSQPRKKGFRPELKEELVFASVAKGDIDVETAVDILVESTPSFSRGEKVYVAHGIGAGWFGEYMGDSASPMYATVKARSAGTFKKVPKIFLQKSLNN